MPITLDGTNGITTPMYNGSITANAVTPSVNMKNRIINGQMVLDQRNAGASVTPTATGFNLDRWSLEISQASKLSVQQNAGSVTPPAGFVNYLGITTVSAYTPSASESFNLRTFIEGYNIADLNWGTANAKTVTLSFQVYSSLTGTFGGALRNDGNNRSYPFTYSIPAANTWTTISITIAGDTTGTWNTTNQRGIAVIFGLGVGSTNSGTAGAWAAANYQSATGATSVVGTNGATFYITGVQLEVGSTATSFDYRPIGTELALCQRYYVQFLGNNTYETLASGMSSTSQNGYVTVALPVTMRANPTLTYSTVSSTLRWTELANSFNGTAIAIDQASTKTPFIYITVASGMTSYRAGFITANNSTSAYVGFSAEL
jgi:hypothetical protein